jgi:hypothetical protein
MEKFWCNYMNDVITTTILKNIHIKGQSTTQEALHVWEVYEAYFTSEVESVPGESIKLKHVLQLKL